jgi:hypothetical protein
MGAGIIGQNKGQYARPGLLRCSACRAGSARIGGIQCYNKNSYWRFISKGRVLF